MKQISPVIHRHAQSPRPISSIQASRSKLSKSGKSNSSTNSKTDVANLMDTPPPPTTGTIANGPITPAFAKQRFRDVLTTYENTEISSFKQIYYVGALHRKVNVRSSASNYGFDLPSAHYKAQTGDHIAYRYEIIAILGRGSFGEVLKCYDHKEKRNVAIKVLVNTPIMNKQSAIEIENMKLVSKTNSEYVALLTDSFSFRNHKCIVTEILGNSLLKQMEIKGYAPFPLKQLKSLTFDLVNGLYAIHSSKVIHADLKPENILLRVGSTMHCKIIDFGSSCQIGKIIYNYVQSRYYRAPEIILGIPYGPAIDIWSLGCIIAEFIIGKPLFDAKGDNDQIKKFVEVIGNPPSGFIAQSPRKKQFAAPDGKLLTNPTPFKNRLSSILKSNDQLMIDFLTKCLEWDPTKRITAAKALQHPWITKPPK